MKLTEGYGRNLNGVCRLTAPFDTVLFLLDALHEDTLSPQDKIRLCFRLLFGRRARSMAQAEQMVNDAFDALMGPQKAGNGGPQVIDFEQDADLIRSAFKQQYGIDLDRERGRMSWDEFMEKLSAITNATALGRVIEIRSAKVPAATKDNRQQREALLRAKAAVAIKPKAKGHNHMNDMWNEIAEMLIKQAKG